MDPEDCRFEEVQLLIENPNTVLPLQREKILEYLKPLKEDISSIGIYKVALVQHNFSCPFLQERRSIINENRGKRKKEEKREIPHRSKDGGKYKGSPMP